MKSFLLLLIAGLLLLAGACKPEQFATGAGDMLTFSEDTIVFDTVITQIAPGTPKSVNRQFLVKNPHGKSIRTSLFLAGGDKSPFRLNVDGDAGLSFQDLEIRPHDSLFVFVEVYANPNGNPAGNPLIVRDSIVFQTNGNLQNVQLVAWGQDANFYYRDSTETNLVWADKTKPYVVYEYFYVKPGATLTIREGVKVYFSPYATLYTEGKLLVEGTASEPVIFEGDRTSDKNSDKFSAYKYAHVPGQWFGLAFGWPTAGNVIRHARIKNGTIGVYMDSSSFDGQPNVRVYNSFIQNMTYSAVRGTRSTFYSENSVFANCGSACVYTFKGGQYDLRHCTISGYCDFGGGTDPAVAVSNRLRNDFGQVIETYPISFICLNSIVWGESKDEIVLDIDAKQPVNLSPLNSLFRSSNATLGQAGTNNILNQSPKFKDFAKYRFDLDTLSPARDAGSVLTPAITTDYSGKIRDAKPDMGAFERFE